MGMIQEFQRADARRRKEVAALGREVATRLGDFRKGDAERRREVAAIKVEVADMRADADAFVGELHQVSADRRKEVAALVAEADAFVRHLQQLSTNRRKEVAGIRSAADAFVHHLHRVSAGRRKEVAAIHAEVWGGAAPAAVRKPTHAPAAPAPAKGAPTTLRDVIFPYLAEHPDGAKLTQMEQDMGIARIRIARAMRGLIDGKKVRKRGLLYFAV